MHLNLTQQQQNACPCGAVAEHLGGICRKCLARLAWRERHTNPKRTTRHRRRTGRLSYDRARNLALTASKVKHCGKAAELS